VIEEAVLISRHDIYVASVCFSLILEAFMIEEK
jgi:hypothetical protein